MGIYLLIWGITWTLAIAATVYSTKAYIAYSQKANTGEVNNNIVSWFIWAFVTVTNASSYFNMNKDWAMTILPATGSIACLCVFVYMLFNGVYERPKKDDWLMLTLGLGAVVVWIFGGPTLAHFTITATFAVSVIPIFQKIFANPLSESPLPWSLWCRAFSLGVIVALIRSSSPADFVYPGGCLIGHTTLTFVTKRARAKAARRLKLQSQNL
ncbi:MAG: hypothetical protein HY226_06075 [Candidatus Vogelbacteria bacterium]|nr:hypothetical protein [Candidatus Vogelbacteria bacterium]